MKHLFIIAAVVMSVLSFAMPVAAETLTGALTVEKNDDDAVVKATLTVSGDSEVAYNVVLDQNGKKLAADMADKKVEVTGTVSKKEVDAKDDDGNAVKNTELWLTVTSFKAVAEKAAASDDE